MTFEAKIMTKNNLDNPRTAKEIKASQTFSLGAK